MSTIAAAPLTDAGSGQLILAAVLGIVAVILLIAWAKWHPLLALIIGSAVLGLGAGASPGDTVTSFTTGLGTTVGSVGLLIALGSMIGALLADSGGADGIVNRIVNSVSGAALPWAMAGVAALIGLPLFFEVGVVLLVPIVLLVARRTDIGLLRVGIPALAGLSVLHGLVPPHPGPLVAISSLNADLGLTLLFGLICAIPTVIVAGPVFGNWIAKRVPVAVPAFLEPATVSGGGGDGAGRDAGARGPGVSSADARGRGVSGADARGRGVSGADARGPGVSGADVPVPGDEDYESPVRHERAGASGHRGTPGFWPAVLTVLLPIVLMLAR